MDDTPSVLPKDSEGYEDERIAASNSSARLIYLDEVSAVSLQMYNIFIYQKLLNTNATVVTDEWLYSCIEGEWIHNKLAIEHWNYAIHDVPQDPTEDGKFVGRDSGRAGMSLHDFLEYNIAKDANLNLCEVLALRLYTGKGFYLINTSCRSANGNFAATVFAINRAIGKLALLCMHDESFPSTFFRGINGRLRIPFQNSYYKEGATSGNLGRLCDCAIFSTTSDITVATGAYGGELLFVLSCKVHKVEDTPQEIDANFQLMSTPAPVRWISQFLGEDEYLWPTNTSLAPKIKSCRSGITFDGREVYEFTPSYLWDKCNYCIGRYKDIANDEMEMARMTLKLAAKGLGMQDAHIAIQQILVDKTVDDEDFDVEEAASIAFCVFDRTGQGWLDVTDIKALVSYFYCEVLGLNRRDSAAILNKISRDVSPFLGSDGRRIRWIEFKNYCFANVTKA